MARTVGILLRGMVHLLNREPYIIIHILYHTPIHCILDNQKIHGTHGQLFLQQTVTV